MSAIDPIRAACGKYIGITEQAECALAALAIAGITGNRATQIAAAAAADVAAAYNSKSRASWRTAEDYMDDDTARRLQERDVIVTALRALANQQLKAA